MTHDSPRVHRGDEMVAYSRHLWVKRKDFDYMSCEATCCDGLPRPSYTMCDDIVDYWEETHRGADNG